MRSVLLALSLLFLALPATAADWIVERATRGVEVSPDARAWQPVLAGMEIPDGHWIRTGGRDRVILMSDAGRIMYRGDTLAALSVEGSSRSKTTVRQQRGSILFAIQERTPNRVSVLTPHLAAVVKGTVFEVSVGRGGSDVRVDRGLVGVSDATGRTVDVPRGQQASAGDSGRGLTVSAAATSSLNAAGGVMSEVRSLPPQERAEAASALGQSIAEQAREQDGHSVRETVRDIGGGMDVSIGGNSATSNGGGESSSDNGSSNGGGNGNSGGASASVGSGGASVSVGGVSVGIGN